VALVVESGAGLSNADSYLSVDDADTYHTAQGAPTVWSDSTDPEKEAALRQATAYLDNRYAPRWVGSRINSTMSLAWPRRYATDRDGYTISESAVPRGVKNATAYIALKIREGDTLVPDVDPGANAISESITIDSISITSTYSSDPGTAPLYPQADMMLRDLIQAAGSVARA
jgi:hypothetical protein